MSIPGYSLEGRVAIVTGARRGIGEAIALMFAEAGSDVIVCDAVVEGGELEAVADRISRPVVNPYPSSKAGLMLLTRGLAGELGPYNIRVNAIAPGGVRTEMLRPLWSDPEALKEFESRTALGRMTEPADIASVALFLASDGSGYITGQTIIVDGGLLA